VSGVKRLAAESGSEGPPSTDELAGALHEVSNTLTVVLGWLDAAKKDAPTGALSDAIEVALTHARLGHTIARRAIGAAVEESSAARSAIAVAEDAIRGIRQEARRAGVQVRVEDQAAHDALLTNAPVAQQILTNLLLNAIAFSPSGTLVVLDVRSTDGPMQFRVIDSGPGVPRERVACLFDSPESTRPGGAGIGLRHAHALALRHGGELSLASTGPTGSEFALLWPTGEEPSRAHRTIPPQALDGVRVLVLEDDPAVQALIELGLSTRGAAVASASTLEELMVMLEHGVFDVALVDLSPLGKAPAEALGRMESKQKELRIVVISGSVAPDVDAPNIAAWVRKPFEVSELVQAIASLPH